MKQLKETILEKLIITKDTKEKSNISGQWVNKDTWTKYKYDAIYYVLNLIKDKINWNKSITSIAYLTFDDTTLTGEDLEKLNKTLGKDFEKTDFYLASHEWNYDWNKKSYLTVIIFKEKLIDIHNSLMHQDKYNLTLCGDAVDFYKNYYKDTI